MNRKLNILYTTTSTGKSGGVRQLLINIKAMLKLGHRIFITCPTESYILKKISNITYFPIPKTKYQFLVQFNRIIGDYNINIVHCFHGKLYKLFLLIKLINPKFKLFLNRGVIFKPGSFPLLWLPQLDGIICNSQAAANILKKYLIPKQKIHVVYNAVDIFHSKSNIQKYKKFTITFIGNKRPYKGFDIFLKSISVLFKMIEPSNLNINIVGISFNKNFQNIVNPFILSKINFLGSMPHQKVLDILASTDVLAITSRQESMPNVLLEAYALGIPVVATKVGGIPEILKEGQNGFLCPSESTNCIAKKITILYNNPEIKKKISKYNLQIAKKDFSIQKKGNTLESIYKKYFTSI